ncbi:GNAT family N-acetyltransferase [Iodobacter sp. LRB]|uniref:GNAT family N-acetyltransferase n=1 Tax=unclassified Iodobacter TaxID=235634 RepID=UPI000C103547|nr:GNAT family N-acetyltransferase [Iodobacter sp. BJB302]PHV02910.1 hypothetical protein CSQ88_04715 [Iodobacter sp. BJB302]
MTLQLMPLTDEDLQTARNQSTGMPGVETAALVPAFVAERAAQMLQAGVAAAWARPFYILRPGDLLAVGSCGFKQAPQQRRVEIGYAVLAAHQGQGFATAAVAALLRLAFLSGEPA